MSDQASTPTATPSSTPTSEASDTTQTIDTSGNSVPAQVVEVAADAQATLADPNASKAQKVEAKKTLNKIKLKIDGQEFEENLPFEIPDDPKAIEYLRRELQLGRMGQKRASEKAAMEKDLIQLVKDMKEDPFKVMSDPAIGVNVKDAIQKYIEKEIEDSKKSPEQLELEKVRAELKAEREAKETEKKQRDTEEQQRLSEKYAEEYDTQITQALESSKIPKSPAAVKKILDYMELAVSSNKDVTINDILPYVKDELLNDYKEHAKALPDEALEEFFGKEIIERLRKVNVAKVKASNNPAVKAPTKVASTGTKTEEPKEAKKKIKYADFFKLNK